MNNKNLVYTANRPWEAKLVTKCCPDAGPLLYIQQNDMETSKETLNTTSSLLQQLPALPTSLSWKRKHSSVLSSSSCCWRRWWRSGRRGRRWWWRGEPPWRMVLDGLHRWGNRSFSLIMLCDVTFQGFSFSSTWTCMCPFRDKVFIFSMKYLDYISWFSLCSFSLLWYFQRSKVCFF